MAAGRDREIDRVIDRRLLHRAQDRREQRVPGALPQRAEDRGIRALLDAHREAAVGALVIGDAEANLLQVVGALGPTGRLAGRLYRGEQQSNQDGDDGDDDQQFDEGETAKDGFMTAPLGACFGTPNELSVIGARIAQNVRGSDTETRDSEDGDKKWTPSDVSRDFPIPPWRAFSNAYLPEGGNRGFSGSSGAA